MSDASPNEPEGLSQEDIDAALNDAQGAADGGTSSPGGESARTQPASIPPTDASDETASPEETVSADSPEAEPAVEGLSQADIDAALSAAIEETSAESSDASQPDGQAEVDSVLAGQVESDPQPEASSPVEPTHSDGSPNMDSTGKPFDEAATSPSPTSAPEPAPTPAPVSSMPLELPELGQVSSSAAISGSVKLLSNVDLHVKVELGRAEMAIEDVLRLGSGAVVELNKLAGDPVDVLVNDRLVALGEVLILNDNFCVRISEIKSGIESEELVDS